MEAYHNIENVGLNTNYPLLPDHSKTDLKGQPLLGITKKSFLVFSGQKYITVPTEAIAFFYIKYDASVIVTFDKKEYTVNYSLDQLENLLPQVQFYRLNRQCLINFNAVKEVEHYFARKLLVAPTIHFNDKLIVSKEKARKFLDWLENR